MTEDELTEFLGNIVIKTGLAFLVYQIAIWGGLGFGASVSVSVVYGLTVGYLRSDRDD